MTLSISPELKGHPETIVGMSAIPVSTGNLLHDRKPVSLIETPCSVVHYLNRQFNLPEARRSCRFKNVPGQAASETVAFVARKDEDPEGSWRPVNRRPGQHEGKTADYGAITGNGPYEERQHPDRMENSIAERSCGHTKEETPHDAAERQRLRAEKSGMEKPLALALQAVVGRMNLGDVLRPHGSDTQLGALHRPGGIHQDASMK